nr:hemin uptake protein HemP [Halomonas socia]
MTSPPPHSPASDVDLRMRQGRIASERLLDARGVLIIEHRGREYQLRETRNGKLILTS